MFDFESPKKVDVIIYGNRGEDIIKKIIGKKTIKCISHDSNFNFFILLKTILKFKFSFSNYLEEYISVTRPKLLISNIDNEPFLWNYKYKYNFLNVIIIQFALRSRVHDLFGISNIDQIYSRKNAVVDYFFVFNTNVIREYKKLLHSNFIVNGSIINNEIKSIKSTRQKEISFISQYRPNQKTHPTFIVVNGINITKDKFYNTEFKLLPILLKFCNLNSLKLSVIGCSSSQEEILFFDSILGNNNYIFYPKTDKLSSYNIALTSTLNVTVDSTLGYECFSRGIKTIFITNRAQDLNEDSAKFGWPGNYENHGEFWLNGLNELHILNLIEKVYQMNLEDFHDLRNKYSKDFLYYDEENKELKKIVKQILIN